MAIGFIAVLGVLIVNAIIVWWRFVTIEIPELSEDATDTVDHLAGKRGVIWATILSAFLGFMIPFHALKHYTDIDGLWLVAIALAGCLFGIVTRAFVLFLVLGLSILVVLGYMCCQPTG